MEKDKKEVVFEIPRDRELLDALIKKLNSEVTLYRNELRRALERYREAKEPVFFVNGCSIALTEMPLVIEKVMFGEKEIGLMLNFFSPAFDSERIALKKAIIETIYYLKSLPGAKDRLPEISENLNKWLRE